MSNLYKQRYIVTHEDNARIINSNDRIEVRMQELQEMMKQVSNGQSDGFVEGLQAEEVEVEVASPEELLQKAQEESEEILADAGRRAESMIANAKEQAEDIRGQARKDGYEDGFREGNERADRTLSEMKQQMEEERAQLQEDYRQKIEELEPYLVDIIADVFEKVFHVQFDDKKEILIYLIQKVILNAEGIKEFQVRVSIKDYEFVENHRNEITEQVGDSVKVDIMADASLQESQCMIETDSGVFDCGRDVQLEQLIKTIRSLSL